MNLSNKLLKELQNRLKVGTRRGVHLNAVPGRSRYKFDLYRLFHFDKDLPQQFVDALLTEQPLKFKIRWKDKVPDGQTSIEERRAQLVKISRSFENLINQTETIESEKGINTFGFGFPLLIRRDKADNKLTVAPILIWSLRIKRSRELYSWLIQRNEDDAVYVNEVLINHLQSDSNLIINQLSSEMLDDGLIDRDELLDICVDLIKSININTQEDVRVQFSHKLSNVKSIPDKEYFEQLPLAFDKSVIEFCGLFSIFEVQKQNIINDYDDLLQQDVVSLDLDDLTEHSFQSISAVETDPSQQHILNSLESTRNILIQGPPGTGKSQTLTAVLINALANHKKTIVVCEKRTALEVLQNALTERGLGELCILIKDPIKDRRAVVNSVRDRIDNAPYHNTDGVISKDSLSTIINSTKSLIDSINKKHSKLDQKLFSSANWTQTVGMLLSEMRQNNEDYELDFGQINFEFDLNELDVLLEIVQKGQALYDKYRPYQNLSFLNSTKLVGDNPYALEQRIKDDFKNYSKKFHGDDSKIRKIRTLYESHDDFFNFKKTKSIGYRLAAIFAKNKRQVLADQKRLFKLCNNLANEINKDGWCHSIINLQSSFTIIDDIESLLSSYQEYFGHKDDVFPIEFSWFHFYNSISDDHRKLIDMLKEKDNWKRVLLINYLNKLLLKHASTNLPTSDNDHKELRKLLGSIEEVQLKYIKEYWYLQQIKITREFNARNQNIAVQNLYNKRSSHKHKRLSLRQIVMYDPDLFTTFFPIVLTTPNACSNLFNAKIKYFDIVLFDEASQLRLEDNLPALLKAKQVIVAGDEHQMPPSNYFSKIFDGMVEDEEDIEEENNADQNNLDIDDLLLSCESLLDFASELRFKKRYLDFHYRSQHPYLIDFSNHAFYNKRLKPLPNIKHYTPIEYVPANGVYSDHVNEIEADAVLSIIQNNINRHSNGQYPSVGVATFNIAQRDLIIDKIRKLQKKSPEFYQKITELQNAGLFVKNLENIQGDERDIIILSTTYGKDENGKFAQRFGPINHKKGYKLLNVIITRAKHKLYVCSSIPEEVFLDYERFLMQEGENNRRAIFYAYLTYAKAVTENNEKLRQSVLDDLLNYSTDRPSSDPLRGFEKAIFEKEVFLALTDHFDKTHLFVNSQFAGFNIDIVFDPKIEGVPKIAIECDGAKNHSSKEAYLYDLHRQKILEKHGFIFHRIWSTNWWRNPTKEINRLVEFINHAVASEA